MAIGIDRQLHRKLLTLLEELSINDEHDQSWKSIGKELQRAYYDASQSIGLAELKTANYNNIQAKVRNVVAIAQRNKKRELRPKKI